MKPRIAISPGLFPGNPERRIFKGMALLYAEQHLATLVERCGGIPFILPTPNREAIEATDGLLLAGGINVESTRYGEELLEPELAGHAERDAIDFTLFEHAMELGKPIFGLCRGHQVINVALGGTLYQHLPTQIGGSILHRNWELYEQNIHPIQWESGEVGVVNSIHDQAIKDLGSDLKVEARAPDGVIEAVRLQSKQYVRGVQWHPEWQHLSKTPADDPKPIVREFIEACMQTR